MQFDVEAWRKILKSPLFLKRHKHKPNVHSSNFLHILFTLKIPAPKKFRASNSIRTQLSYIAKCVGVIVQNENFGSHAWTFFVLLRKRRLYRVWENGKRHFTSSYLKFLTQRRIFKTKTIILIVYPEWWLAIPGSIRFLI